MLHCFVNIIFWPFQLSFWTQLLKYVHVNCLSNFTRWLILTHLWSLICKANRHRYKHGNIPCFQNCSFNRFVHLFVNSFICKLLIRCSFQVVVKSLPANAGGIRDLGLTPGSGRSPGGGHGNPFHYPCLENALDRGAWQGTVHKIAKGHDWSDLAHV